MKNGFFPVGFGVGLCLIVVGGCALKDPQPRNSRFLGDYSEFRQLEVFEDTWVYRHPKLRAVHYAKYYIPAFSIYENPRQKISKEDRKELNKLSENLHTRFVEEWKKDFPVVETPEPETLELQIAIIDIKKFVRLTNENGNEVVHTNNMLNGTKLEIDAIDMDKGERVFALTSLFPGKEFEAYNDLSHIPNVEKAFDEWSRFLRTLLDEVHKHGPID